VLLLLKSCPQRPAATTLPWLQPTHDVPTTRLRMCAPSCVTCSHCSVVAVLTGALAKIAVERLLHICASLLLCAPSQPCLLLAVAFALSRHSLSQCIEVGIEGLCRHHARTHL
jgi:hypothetical protein